MTPSSTNERRGGSRRKEPLSTIRAFDRESEDFLGHIQDLTLTGMCLVCDLDEPEIGRALSIVLQGPGATPVVANVTATIRWIREAEHEGYRTLGFEFDLHQTAEDEKAIARLAVLACH
jgi:hypothetical protein